MRHTKRCGALVVCTLVSGLLAWPASSRAEVSAQLTCWPFHREAAPCASCAAPTTYAPPYNANRIVWMPSYGVTTTCNPLVPQSCGYGVTAYLPAGGCCPSGGCGGGCCPTGGCCGGCAPTVAYTTYRPFLSWLFRPFEPYPVYRMAFYAPLEPACGPACCAAPACSACPTCPTCPTCATCPTSACFAPACPTCSSCPSCASCAGEGCAACDGCASPACEGGSCAGGCASCAAGAAPLQGASEQPSLPGPVPYLNEANPLPGNPPADTFKPSSPSTSEPKASVPPAVNAPASGMMSEPRPMPPGPIAARPIRQATYLLPAAVSVRSKKPLPQTDDSDDGWHDARD